MLIYHPAMDAYHCVFRFLIILSSIESIEIDKARILDFYLLFPSALASATLPSNLRSGRTIAKSYRNPYRDAISPRTSFRGIADIQASAVNCIAGSGLIELENLKYGYLRRTEKPLPSTIEQGIQRYTSEHASLVEYLLQKLATVPLLGPDGLKQRTSLMEHRYDYA